MAGIVWSQAGSVWLQHCRGEGLLKEQYFLAGWKVSVVSVNWVCSQHREGDSTEREGDNPLPPPMWGGRWLSSPPLSVSFTQPHALTFFAQSLCTMLSSCFAICGCLPKLR